METSKRSFTAGILFTIITIVVLSFGCNSDPDNGTDPNVTTDSVVTKTSITGLVAPETGSEPRTNVDDSDQYSVKSVSWSPSANPFEGNTVYTAAIVLEAKTGYTFEGLAANKFSVDGATTVTNPAGEGKTIEVTAVFPKTTANPPTQVTHYTITGVTQPIVGETPVTTALGDGESEKQFSVSEIAWAPSVSSFKGEVSYTATITLIATAATGEDDSGYTFEGLAANKFSVDGATTVTNPAGEGSTITVTAVFPATDPATVNYFKIYELTKPALAESPDTDIRDESMYSGTSVIWSPELLDGKFKGNTVYTATITLEAKTGYTFDGVAGATNKFIVADATSVTNPAGTSKTIEVTAVFPATAISREIGTTYNKSSSQYETIDVNRIFTLKDYLNIYYGSSSTKMIFAANIPGAEVPINYSQGKTGNIPKRFYIAETETTNKQALDILQWALDNGKLNTGTHNNLSERIVMYGQRILIDLVKDDVQWSKITYDDTTKTFGISEGYEDYPLNYCSWFGAVMLCNWLTEMRDGNTNNVVYTGIPTDGTYWHVQTTNIDLDKNGYRLTDFMEWHWAARWAGNYGEPESTYILGEYTSPYFTDDNTVSGAESTSDAEKEKYAHINATGLMPVAQLQPNVLGLYDMSANVAEWIDVYYPEGGNPSLPYNPPTTEDSYLLGGAFNTPGAWFMNANPITTTTYSDDNGIIKGFRFARTAIYGN